MRFLRIISPFYLIVAAKLVADGVLRGAGMMKKVYGDDLQRFDSARCACGGIIENRTRNNRNLACMAHRLDDCNRAVVSFLRHGRLEKNTLKRAKKAFLSKRKTTKRNLKCRRNKSFRNSRTLHETCSVQSRKKCRAECRYRPCGI